MSKLGCKTLADNPMTPARKRKLARHFHRSKRASGTRRSAIRLPAGQAV